MLEDSRFLQKQTLQLRLLNELSTLLLSLSESESFYQEVVNTIQARFNYNCIHIWSVESDQSAILQAQAGAYRNHIRVGHVLNRNQGITGVVIRTKKSYLSND